MACVAVNSLMRTIELEFLKPHPRPILQQNEVIPPNKELIQSLHKKLGFLIEQLDEKRMDGFQGIKELETELRDVAFRVEDEIEHGVVDLYKEEEMAGPFVEKQQHILRLHHILQQAIEENDEIKEDLVKLKKLPKPDEVITMGDSSQHASHRMQLLSENESWYLFCQKAGIHEGVEFEKIGRQIVEKCEGLPLAIVVVGGLFSKLNTLDEWKNMAKALNYTATQPPQETGIFRMLSMLYNCLPHGLTACFLYLGVFPEDEEIYAKDVARLWAAEGLVKESENKSTDAVAKRYIDELRDRNLIFVSKLSCSRKVKASRMHDLVHDFCVREAQRENLLHVVTKYGSISPPKGRCRWVSIQSANLDISTLYSSSIKCRSIFCFSEVTSLYLENFSLLRVFYFTDASMCKKIVDLVHLRYLPLIVRNFRILKLLRAWNLQTLSIYADDGRNDLNFPQQPDSNCAPKLVLKPCHCTIEFFCKNTHLKKVGISGERRDCNDCIENLVYLPLLRRLYINGNVRDYRTPDIISINYKIAQLKSLKWLSFRSMNFEWKGINVLCKLPKLEMLRLIFSGIGKEWELPEAEEEVFSQLSVLEIFSNDLKQWKACAYHFPKLEYLFLRECSQLEEIPVDFAKISNLKLIELTRCLPSAVTSAKKIKEKHHGCGNLNIIVIKSKKGNFPRPRRII